jgi:uncharacterized protein (TIGR00304 family)
MKAEALYTLGFALIFCGILIILAAVLLLFYSNAKGGKIKGGGIILIGPFPIVFGTDKETIKTVLLLSIVLVLLLTIVTIILYLLLR